MRLLLVIVSQKDANPVTNGLVAAGFHVTQLASTGGFLRQGNVTLLIGIEDEKADEALEIIGKARGKDVRRQGVAFVLKIDRMIRVDEGTSTPPPTTEQH